MANLNQIEHVVVLMLENRSFDNVLGWLYDPGNPSPFNREPPTNFEGLYGKNLSNVGPNGVVTVAKGQTPTDPFPDPGEPYEDVYEQLYMCPPFLLIRLHRPRPPRRLCRGLSTITQGKTKQIPKSSWIVSRRPSCLFSPAWRSITACATTGSVPSPHRRYATAHLFMPEPRPAMWITRGKTFCSSIGLPRSLIYFLPLNEAGRSTPRDGLSRAW